MNNELLHSYRRAELMTVRDAFNKTQRVVEIGAGTGFQASIIAGWVRSIRAFDVADSNYASDRFYTVEFYDGKKLPVESGSADLVFTSNCIEHISQLDDFLAETRRLLDPNGIAVHIVPSSAWRIVTIITGLLLIAKKFWQFLLGICLFRKNKAVRWTTLCTAFNSLIERHGEHGNALTEVYLFSRSRWKRIFENGGFELLAVRSTPLLYSGHGLFGQLIHQKMRIWLGSVFGGTCTIYHLRLRAK